MEDPNYENKSKFEFSILEKMSFGKVRSKKCHICAQSFRKYVI